MMKKKVLIFCLLLLPFWAVASADTVNAALFSEDESLQPGVPSTFAVHLDMEEGWHTYWSNPGQVGLPTEITWHLPEGFEVGPVKWPVPNYFVSSGMVGFGYEGDAWFLVEITPPKSLRPGREVDLRAEISWLACSDECVPGDQEVRLTLPVKTGTPRKNPSHHEIFAAARQGLPRQLVPSSVHLQEGSLNIVWAENASSVLGVSLQAYFFPDLDMPVDIETDQMLTMAGDDDFTYRLQVPLRDGLPSQMKGVLVISDGASGQRSAYEVDFPVGAATAVPAEQLGFAWILLLAFFGGMILNLMPCVLPVISLKVLSFVNMAGEDRRKTLAHGLVFAAGVMVSFWVLVGLLLGLRASGEMVGWGFQLQDPRFVLALIFVLFLVGLNLFGVFEMGMSLTGAAGQAQRGKSGFSGSFFSGVLATAVATPCTGPFLGTALGAAMALPAALVFMAFSFIALGMCFPYILCAAFPQGLRFLPKPGPWMERFKQSMGFVMMASVLWLLWVLAVHVDINALIGVLGALMVVSFAVWVYGSWASPLSKVSVRRIAQVLTLVLLIVGFRFGLQAVELGVQAAEAAEIEAVHEGRWEKFTMARLNQLRAQGQPVLIDYTAKWCLTCQANKVALHNERVMKKLDQLGVTTLVADWTKSDPEITASLQGYGRSGVPLYVLYGCGPASQPTILPQTLTPDIVLSYLEQLH